uniref:Putative gypsy nogag n=1 Tax=Ixodes ricinus TaxID=34613 RepID=A0A0K8R912_IXORI
MRSEWASPIVPVMKANGQARICGDYKVTLNPTLKPDRYPLPKTEDLFVKIAHGEKFTKLDCKQAYFQIPLAEESRNLTVINTHKGLYQVNRVPFGITPASAIFQRVIEELVGNLPYTGAFQDDIVVTGKNDQHHLRNLDIVLPKTQGKRPSLREKKNAASCRTPSST